LDRYRASLGRAVDEVQRAIFILPEQDSGDIDERRQKAEQARLEYERISQKADERR